MHRPSRRLGRTVSAAAPLLGALAFAAPAIAEVEAGRNLEANTSLEFALAEGWPAGHALRMDLMRGTTRIATKSGTGPSFEVNHVGGSDCWEDFPAGSSPDLRGGDRIVVTDLDASAPDVDDVVLAGLDFTEAPPGTVSGTATGVQPDAELAAHRREGAVRNDAPFTPGAGGAFSVALGGTPGAGEVSVDHITNAGGGTGITVAFPAGAEESACGPVLQSALTDVSHAAVNGETVADDLVVGGPRGDGVTVTATFAGEAYPVTNGTGTWRTTIPAADLAALANDADHQLVASFSDGPDQSRTIRKDVTAPVVTPSVAPGRYDAPVLLALSSDGGEAVRYTLDGSAPGPSSPQYQGIAIRLGAGTHTVRATATDAAGNRSERTLAYTVDAPAQTPSSSSSSSSQSVTPSAVTPLAPAGPAVTPTSTAAGVRAVRVPGRVRLAGVRRRGVRVAVDHGRGRLVVTLLRRSGRRLVRVNRVVRSPQAAGRLTLRLGARRVRPGRYVVRAAQDGVALDAPVRVVR